MDKAVLLLAQAKLQAAEEAEIAAREITKQCENQLRVVEEEYYGFTSGDNIYILNSDGSVSYTSWHSARDIIQSAERGMIFHTEEEAHAADKIRMERVDER